MSDPGMRPGGHTWPYAFGGAVLLFGVVVLANAGEYEGGDVVLVLGPLAAIVGGLVGVLVGGLINGHRPERQVGLCAVPIRDGRAVRVDAVGAASRWNLRQQTVRGPGSYKAGTGAPRPHIPPVPAILLRLDRDLPE